MSDLMIRLLGGLWLTTITLGFGVAMVFALWVVFFTILKVSILRSGYGGLRLHWCLLHQW